MHFLPEYFPNRELGITLYHMDQFEDAALKLEKSLELQYSARGDGLITNVRRANYSEAEVALDPEFSAPDSIAPGDDTYLVITK